MGYSEVYCHICGVSFNIGRIRRPDEPASSAWDNSGYSTGYFVCSPADNPAKYCPKEAGCLVVRRAMHKFYGKRPTDNMYFPDLQDASCDESEDGDFTYESAEDDDPYEYDTPGESDPEDSITGDSVELEPDTDSVPESDKLYAEFVRGISTAGISEVSSGVEEMVPQYEQGADNTPDDQTHQLEHIAGSLSCRVNSLFPMQGGCNGHAISVDEMKGCNTLQCFVRKPDWYWVEPDDEDFEVEGHFFLSGLSDLMPSRDYDPPKVFPERHGCDKPYAENIMWEPEKWEEFAMPFHPTCLEAFKRASLMRTGSIDIEGLTNWWAVEATPEGFNGFPRDPAVDHSQWHEHIAGNEFVAANPCFVPLLSNILASADRSADASFVYGDVFDVKNAWTRAGDLFSHLPQELKTMLLVLLDPADIANLRLASRAFRQLSQSFFRSLVLREMPWLWEAWSPLDYSFWSTTTSFKLKLEDEEKNRRLADIKDVINVLYEEGRHEGLPAENDAAISAMKQLAIAEESNILRSSVSVPLFVADKTDWYHLCRELAKNHSRLLGLRNRRRIWKDCQEILDRIERYRDEGRFIPGQAVDPRPEIQASIDRRIEANRRWARYCDAGRPGGKYNPDDWATPASS